MCVDPHKKYDPEILKIVKNFRILDDNFMVKIFESRECLQYVLRVIMGIPSLKVESHSVQYSLNNLQGRSVRFDVWAMDNTGAQYNIEIQRKDKGAGKERARYYSAMLDCNLLMAGQDFERLPTTYVIFVTESDVLKGGRLCYHIDRIVRETGNMFDDREHIIYVNGSYTDVSTELGQLMVDFRERDPSKMASPILRERARYFKEAPEGVDIMCRAVEELQMKAAAEAEAKAKAADEARVRAENEAAKAKVAAEAAKVEAAAARSEAAAVKAEAAAEIAKIKAEAEAKIAQIKAEAEAKK